MGYNTKNYTEQGGEKTVIGGEIVIEGKISVADGGEVVGVVTPAANVAEAAGANPTAAEFKALLDALIAAGLMEAAE